MAAVAPPRIYIPDHNYVRRQMTQEGRSFEDAHSIEFVQWNSQTDDLVHTLEVTGQGNVADKVRELHMRALDLMTTSRAANYKLILSMRRWFWFAIGAFATTEIIQHLL
jgi:hypothetical protein